MKNIVAIITVILFMLILSSQTSAAVDLTSEEAERLIYDADSLYRYISSGIVTDKDVAVEDFVYRINSISYPELYDRACNVFDVSVAERFLFDNNSLFIADGKLYYATFVPQFCPFSLDETELGFTFDLNIEVESDGDSAVIYFDYIDITAPYPEFFTIGRTNFTAALVDDEWRITGGDYFDKMLDFAAGWQKDWDELLIRYNVAPQTGDGTWMLISLAALSGVVAMSMKRRIAIR